MPIRFRCVYCDQLLGIARRKARTVVRCPGCGGQLVVPGPEADVPDAEPDPAAVTAAPPREPAQAGPRDPGFFERADIDELIRSAPASGPAPSERQAGVRSRPKTAADIEMPIPPALLAPAPGAATARPAPNTTTVPAMTQAGIVLSPFMAGMLSVVTVLALALAFGAGLFVGLALRVPPGP
jgi:DNA-directed RNA polymerase subunit RPC12/RpoP